MILLNIILIIVGVLVGFFFYFDVIRGRLERNTCLVNPSECVRVFFYQYDNSILIHIAETDNWIWYNGHRFFVYHPPISSVVCKDKNTEAAYVLNKVTGLPEEYECIQNKQTILKFYQDKKVSKQELFLHMQSENIDIPKIIHYFIRKGYISI